MKRGSGSLLAACAVAATVMVVVGLQLAGVRVWSVISGSMEPNVPQGSIVVTVRDSNPQPGEILLYDHPGFDEPVLHRYLAPGDEGTLTLQGDANLVPDQPVAAEQLQGRMVAHFEAPRRFGDALEDFAQSGNHGAVRFAALAGAGAFIVAAIVLGVRRTHGVHKAIRSADV